MVTGQDRLLDIFWGAPRYGDLRAARGLGTVPQIVPPYWLLLCPTS